MRALSLIAILGLLVVEGMASNRRSPLAPEPSWEGLHEYQFTITRVKFEQLLDQVFSPDGGMRGYLRFFGNSVTLYSDRARTYPLFSLLFANEEGEARDLPFSNRFPNPSDSEKPLRGLKICLDPGHIGGDFSKLEERFFRIGNDPSVEEAKLNLITCRLLEKELLHQGAEVVWTKNSEDPATTLRPTELREEALRWIFDLGAAKYLPIEEEITRRADMLFYRTAEIRARAERVHQLQPDLTICLHYNAGSWGPDPLHPKMMDKSNLVIFLTGCFTESELKYDDQKFDLLAQLLEQNHEFELGVSSKIAARMKERLKMSPENYKKWPAVHPMKNEPYIYARNLAANRWFRGATVFVEGPYMNAKDAYERIIAGDYEGEKVIAGRKEKSIYQEFAEAVAQGVVDYYRGHKPLLMPEKKPHIQAIWNP